MSVVFFIYAGEVEDTSSRSFLPASEKDAVVAHLQSRLLASTEKNESLTQQQSLERALRYVKQHYDGSVRTIGKREMARCMIPAVIPLARLVAAVELDTNL